MADNLINELDLADKRIEFLAEFTLRTLKLKSDKFTKLYANDEAKLQILEFLEKVETNLLIFQMNSVGTLQILKEWPGTQKYKGVFFMKRREGIPKELSKDQIRAALLFGDLSQFPIDQIAGVIDNVFVPVLLNPKNTEKWPSVVIQDLRRHVSNLKNNIYVVSGQVKGKTLLPMPPSADDIDDDIVK